MTIIIVAIALGANTTNSAYYSLKHIMEAPRRLLEIFSQMTVTEMFCLIGNVLVYTFDLGLTLTFDLISLIMEVLDEACYVVRKFQV